MADDQYFIYETRLASFHGPQPVTKRRASNASSRAPKTLAWPHKFLRPEDLARAGFLFNPSQHSPDNVECFLCHKSLDGWEAGDNPALEHVTHSPDCGWAIVAAIEAEVGELGKVDPRDPGMVEARKATFAGRWPYEKRKGWKCKTKQLVEAGWKYTPTVESDDNTTCTYCQLALDGWEAGDKPMEEHSRRAPDCPFFQMVNSLPAPKKTARSKAARGSGASRLSIQSLATAVSDLTSIADLAANIDDSVLTATSTMTQSKKTAKTRKAPAAKKGGRSRAKKSEAVEVPDEAMEQTHEGLPPSPPPKTIRGKKRNSDEMEESVMPNAEAPAPKKRATKATRAPKVADDELSVVETVVPAPVRKVSGRKKARTSTVSTKAVRKGSDASIMSTASTASLQAHTMDDDELDRQLQADLERPFTDDGDVHMDSDSERRKASVSKTKKQGKKSVAREPAEHESGYAMFDPAPVEIDDPAIEAELEAMKKEVEAEGLSITKKGRKPGPRKVSKQTKANKEQQEDTAVAPSSDVLAPEDEVHKAELSASVASNATVVQAPPAKRGRGRPKKSDESKQQIEPSEAPAVPAKIEAPTVEKVAAVSKQSAAHRPARVDKSLPPPPPPSSAAKPQPSPATPRASHISPAPSAKQPALSPSQSPQSSDAENQPPSSKPASSALSKRVALALLPVTATPMRSPSKRNVIAGLQSTTPWAAADLDLVFCGSPLATPRAGNAADKENGMTKLLGKGGELTSPEKGMTVEEWIYRNAGLAEGKLRSECEAMVTAFEREGGRAMGVLEGLVVD